VVVVEQETRSGNGGRLAEAAFARDGRERRARLVVGFVKGNAEKDFELCAGEEGKRTAPEFSRQLDVRFGGARSNAELGIAVCFLVDDFKRLGHNKAKGKR